MATAIEPVLSVQAIPASSRFKPEQYLSFTNLAEAFFYNANLNQDLVAYDQAIIDPQNDSAPRRYVSTLQRTSKQRVLQIAAQLDAWNVKPGDAVAIVSLNRPEWTEAEMAIYTVGAVAVAVYVRVSEERLQHILRDSGAKCIIVENEEQLAAVCRARQILSLANSTSSLNPTEDESTEVGTRFSKNQLTRVLVIDDVVLQESSVSDVSCETKTFRQVFDEQPVRDEHSFCFSATTRDDLASVYYTSGSSGMPTGVPVTHGEALANLYQIAVSGLIDYTRYDRPDFAGAQPYVTLILPERAHAFPARNTQLAATSPACARYPAIYDRRSSKFSDGYRDSIRRDIREGAAGIVPIVPKVLITIQQRVTERLRTSGFAGKLARLVIENAQAKILAGDNVDPNSSTQLLYRVLTPLRNRITRKIRKQIIGDGFECFISGGAKLPVSTAAFLWAIGMPVYEGYGSTESNCPVATNTPIHHRLGSVGKLFQGVETRIDPGSGELLLRGPNVVKRYWHVSNDRQAAWTPDGWYRTRDVARLDTEGFLYIDDRVDNILVLWNGENVSAAGIESKFSAIPYVDTAIVIGHHRPVLIALVALNQDAIERWAARAGQTLTDDLLHDPSIVRLIRQEIEEHVNQHAGHPCERIRHVGFIEVPGTEDQTLTATEKIRRREIERRYSDLIEQLYANENEWLPAFGHDGDPQLAAVPVAEGSHQ